MKTSFLVTTRKLIYFLAILGMSSQVLAETSISSQKEVIEVQNPTTAFKCKLGDGGYMPTTIDINSFFIPAEFGKNYESNKGILVYVRDTTSMKAVSCAEAMKPITAEIQKQGGRLQATASREVSLWTLPEGSACRLYLSENLTIQVGPYELHRVKSTFVKNVSSKITDTKSHVECLQFVPNKI